MIPFRKYVRPYWVLLGYPHTKTLPQGRTRPMLMPSPSPNQLNDHVYELYKPTEEPSMDILFFHGLQYKDSTEAYLSTWTCGDGSGHIWPSTWLAQEFPHAQIFSMSYDASMRTSREHGRFDLHNLGENLIQAICSADIGQVLGRPVILVGHSFGGLVIKDLCVRAHIDHSLATGTLDLGRTDKFKRFLFNIRGIFFYGTPHHGSPLFDKLFYFMDGPLISYVRYLSEDSSRLELKFAALCKQHGTWHIASAGESRPTSYAWGLYSVTVVPEGSARYGSEFRTIEADHITLCKPASKTSTSFQCLTDFLQRIQPKDPEGDRYKATAEWKREEASAKLVHDQRETFSERITPDIRYVPMKVSEAKVYKALDNPQGPTVILLHGGPGTGKTTLARNTVVHYKKESDLERQFDHVFFLSCGPEASVEDTLVELILCFGFEPITTPEDGRTRFIRICKHSRSLLEVQKILIILDDVSNGDFLAEIVKLCGNRVKCLVTSQLANLCHLGRLQSSEFLKIQIQDIETEDARKILASHVGLPNQQIPENVQDVADLMISKTESNPLALASLASAIGYDGSNIELKEWQDASVRIFEALHDDFEASLFHAKKYPGSFWSTTRQAIDNLSQDSQNLLFMIHACQGESVRHEVVELLYRGLILRAKKGTFSALRNELQNRQLIKINEVKMECYFNNENEVEKTVVTTLCALYLEEGLANKAAAKVGIPFERFSIQRRRSIEPITFLLGTPLSPWWTKTEQVSTRKVFLNYLFNCILDDSNICHLLQSEVTALSMCKALRDITFIEERCLLDKNTQGLMKVFVSWLAEGAERRKQDMATEVLHRFAYNDLHGMFIVSFPGLLEGIVRLLQEVPSQHFGNEITQSSSSVLRNPTTQGKVGEAHEICVKIRNHSSMCTIVNLPSVQEKAGWILTNLTANEVNEIKLQIVNYPGLLLELVNSLSKEAIPGLQEHAAWALFNLTTGPSEVKVKIVDHPRALFELVNSLSKETNPSLQERAARVLLNLTYGKDGDPVGVQLVNQLGILSKLVNLLSKETHPHLQELAIRILGNLQRCAKEIKDKVFYHPSLLGLVKSFLWAKNFEFSEASHGIDLSEKTQIGKELDNPDQKARSRTK